MAHRAALEFGKVLIGARDAAITDLTADCDGGSNVTGLQSLLQSHRMDETAIRVICDHLFFQIMFAIENSTVEGSVALHLSFEGETVSLDHASDGFAGEFLTEDGWIARYSDYRVAGD